MDAQLKAKWIEALRSDEYSQAFGELTDEVCNAFCCIGVGYNACIGDVGAVASDMKRDRTAIAADALGITASQQIDLVILNDRDKKPFAEIADWIEANL